MTTRRDGSFSAGRAGVLLAIAATALATGCARGLLERAIAARGGALSSLSRVVEAEVHAGFPGRWQWRFDYRVPDQLRWTLDTYGEEQSFAFDGRAVSFYLGSARVAAAPPAVEDFRSHVRWIAVTTLDVLAIADDLVVRDLEPGELPAEVVAGLLATYRDDGARYALYFDEADLLVAAEGPIVLPTIAAGKMSASYSQFRNAAGYLLPYHGSYTLDGQPFFDETVLRYVPNDPLLTPESFRGPPPRAPR